MRGTVCACLFTFELRRIDIDTGWLDCFGVNLFSVSLRVEVCARDINLRIGEVMILKKKKK